MLLPPAPYLPPPPTISSHPLHINAEALPTCPSTNVTMCMSAAAIHNVVFAYVYKRLATLARNSPNANYANIDRLLADKYFLFEWSGGAQPAVFNCAVHVSCSPILQWHWRLLLVFAVVVVLAACSVAGGYYSVFSSNKAGEKCARKRQLIDMSERMARNSRAVRSSTGNRSSRQTGEGGE